MTTTGVHVYSSDVFKHFVTATLPDHVTSAQAFLVCIPCRLRVYDLPPDVLEARTLGNATESSLHSIAAAADTCAPPLTVQVALLLLATCSSL